MKVRKKERTESAAIGLPRKDLRSPSKAVKGGKELVRVTAGDIMTRDVITVSADTPIDKVAEILMDKNIIRVPVTQDGKLTGVVSRCDILRSYMEPEFITHL